MSVEKKLFARMLRRNMTEAESFLWSHIRNKQLYGMKFRRQSPMLGYIVDFYCPDKKIIIEVDGKIHEKTIREDEYRDRVFNSHGLKVIRFSNDVVLNNISFVLKQICKLVFGT